MFTIEQRMILGEEPVTLQEAKTYIRSEESEGIEDDLINGLISNARETIEKLIDRSLVDSSITVFASNWKGNLPLAPVTPNTITFDGIGSVIGNKYPFVNVSENVTINYQTTAYISDSLNYALLELVLFWYERGEFNGGMIPDKIKKQIKIHSRLNFIA